MGKRHLIYLLTILFFVISISLAGNGWAATHTVSPGESLYQISQQYHTTSDVLQRANGLNNSNIYPGQVLWVPTYHFVSPGESLYLIGQKYGVSYNDIMKHNGMRSTSINPGQKLYIPDLQAAQSVRPAQPAQTPVSRSGGVNRLSAAEMDHLARLITSEADCQDYITKVAVGAVVLNRVKSPLFPNTVSEVINQVDEGGRYQFEPVLNGWINRPASEEARRAARDAVNGWDPSNGALFFWESWVTNSYLTSRPVSTVLGAFTFTY